MASGLDLLVTTPGRAASHLKSGALQLSGCKAVVLDEVDVLLGEVGRYVGVDTLLGDVGQYSEVDILLSEAVR